MNDIDTYHMKGHTKLIEKELLCSGDPEEENNRIVYTVTSQSKEPKMRLFC